MKESANTCVRWLIIAPISYIVGFIIFTRPLIGDFHRILNQSGIGNELRISYLASLAVLLVGIIGAFLCHMKKELKIAGITMFILGSLLIPAVLAIVKY